MKDKLLYFFVSLIILFFTGCSITTNTQQIKPFKYSALHSAVRLNQVNNVQKLLEKDNSNINIADNFGDTPLIDAVRYNNTKIVKILLCNGADQNISDTYNLTPLDNAIKNNNQQIVSMLSDKSLSFCQEQIITNKGQNKVIKNTTIEYKQDITPTPLKNNPLNESVLTQKKEDDTANVQNVVIDPKYLSLENTKVDKPTIEKSSLDKIELTDEELEKYINDTKTLGNL